MAATKRRATRAAPQRGRATSAKSARVAVEPDLRPPRVRLDVDKRRAQLVDLGLDHFGRQAYDDVSIDVIAAAAGISKGLLYHYFPTKRAFYVACVAEAAGRLLAVTDRADALGGATASPLDRLERGLDAYLGFVRAHARAYATLMHGMTGDREIGDIVDKTRMSFLGRLTDGLTSAPTAMTRTVILPATPHVRIALRGWVGMAEAMSLGWVEALGDDPTTCPSQTELRDWLATSLIDLVKTLTRVLAPT